MQAAASAHTAHGDELTRPSASSVPPTPEPGGEVFQAERERLAAPLGPIDSIAHRVTLRVLAERPDDPQVQEQWSGRLQGMAMSGLVWRFPDGPWQLTSYARSLLNADPTPEPDDEWVCQWSIDGALSGEQRAADQRVCTAWLPHDSCAIRNQPVPSGSEPVDPAQPGRWRKKPVVIEAMRYTAANGDECAAWVDEVFDGWQLAYGSHPPMLRIRTLEGVMEASEGDWIIRGVQGEFYPCKPDIFAATYEPEDHR
jgi:hypothetical protein